MGCTESKEAKPAQKNAPPAKTAPAPATETKPEPEPTKPAPEPKVDAPAAEPEEVKVEEKKEVVAALEPAAAGAAEAVEKAAADVPADAGLAAPEFEEPKVSGRPDAKQKVALVLEMARLRGEVTDPCIKAFSEHFDQLVEGATGKIPESSITPVTDLPSLSALECTSVVAPQLYGKTVVLKLNGGLGTGMGLSKAKSLLEVKEGQKFLDVIVKQIDQVKQKQSKSLSFVLMNSFSTENDTKAFLDECGMALGNWEDINLVQNKVPKIVQETYEPARHARHELCWCPPGHGDVYAALHGSGMLEKLVSSGKEVLFISNSDNLGAELNPKILKWFEDSDYDFLMEVCERTEADKKGGHLAKKGDSLILRESAQCADEDVDEFQNIQKHKYFNTNNLWIRITALIRKMTENKGKLTLPMIVNKKTVDPTDKNSEKVFQLETAMGAAIETFGTKSAAIVVGRERFAPVKTCNDLFAVRSDAYIMTEDNCIALAPERNGIPPTISLGDRYKMVPALEELTSGYASIPSLIGCSKLTVTGNAPLKFSPSTIFTGEVTINTGDGDATKTLPAGEYTGDVSDKLE